MSRANGASGASGNGSSQLPVTSKDGHLVAFSSSATNLTADTVPAGIRQAYVRNLSAGTTTLASAAANANVSDVGMSDEGRYVVFGTRATNLGPTASGIDRVFVRDTVANTTTLVLENAVRPAISADGSTVAVCSNANIAGTGATGAGLKVYAYDLHSHAFELVSRGTGAGTAITGDNPSVSDDGKVIAFSGQGGTAQVWVRDRTAQTTALVSRASGTDGQQASTSAIEPDISGNGRYVVFRSAATNLSNDDIDTSDDIFERDLVAGTTTLVSRADGATGAGASGDSDLPSVSDDGTRVFFRSRAANLSDQDNDNGDNGFVRDTVTGTTTLVHGRVGQTPPPQGVMDGLAMSGNGRYAVYASSATLLPADETGSFGDVFRRDLGAPPPPPPPPSASIGADQSALEGNASHTLTFAVTLGAADARAIAVDWRTADGTATAGEDYRATSGQVTFAPGQTSAFISVDVLGDLIREADETFSIELTNPQNAKLGRARAQVTIVNDDVFSPAPPPSPAPSPGPTGLPRTSGAPSASCATQLIKGNAVMRGCFNGGGKATGIVSLNGLTVDLLGGVLTAADDKVSSSGQVAISAGDIVIHRGSLSFDPVHGMLLDPPSGTGLYGLTLGSHVAVLPSKDGSAKAIGQATLPFGTPLPLTFTTSDADGLRRDSLVVGGDATIVGNLTLGSLKFTFDPAAAVWRGGLTVNVLKAVTLTGTIDQRGVTSLTGRLIGLPNLLKVRTATVTIVPKPFSLKGDLAYDFGPGPLFTFDGTYTYGSSFSLTGSAKLFGIPLGKLGDIFNAAINSLPGVGMRSMAAKAAIDIGHGLNAPPPPGPAPAGLQSILDGVGGGLLGGVDMGIDLNTGHFSGGGEGTFAVLGVTVGGSITFNQNGFAACGQIGPIQAGFGVRVNPFSLQLMGPFVCDVGPWKATAAQASVTIPDGVHVVRVHGDATLHGPGGRTISTAASQVSPTVAVLHGDGVTYVALKGAWTLDGATDVDIASQLPPVKVTARVVKHTVRYTERVSPGQKIVLAEQSGHELGSLHGAKGTLRFKPAPGGGRRDIVAIVTQRGLPMSRKVIAHYTAPKPPKPTNVRVRAKGTKLTVTWKGSARSYVVVAKTPNGTLVAETKLRHTTLTDIAPVKKATVTITSIDGPAVSARLGR